MCSKTFYQYVESSANWASRPFKYFLPFYKCFYSIKYELSESLWKTKQKLKIKHINHHSHLCIMNIHRYMLLNKKIAHNQGLHYNFEYFSLIQSLASWQQFLLPSQSDQTMISLHSCAIGSWSALFPIQSV